MKKQVSSQYTQLTLDFEFEASTNAVPVIESTKSSALPADYFHFSKADFDEWQATENDIMFGRGAYLYKAIERDLAFQREQAKILRQFEAMRASIYK